MKNNLERLIKQSVPFRSDYIKAEIGMMYLSSVLHHQSFQYFKKYHLSPQQYNILRILRGQYPKSYNLNAIKERMLDKMSDVSRIIERLNKQHLIIKEANIIDKRNADIYISAKGLNLLKEIDTDSLGATSILHRLSPEEVRQLNDLIDKQLDLL
ncbi:MAG: MarR family transcriptional regulator [Bacteroidetes bacterium]|nr:MarR family transcriptional regulator [Bacteroidota bacterium]MBP6315646.1 MarR family transcriptional regulator [Chitinophagaceae bacterium]